MIRRSIDAVVGELHLPWLRYDNGGYTLEVDPDEVDLVQFTRLIARAERAVDEGLPTQALRDIEQAIGLMRGDPLADVADRVFAEPEISRLSDLYLRVREDRALALLVLGHPEQSTAELQWVLDQQPGRERAVTILIVSLYRAGRQVDAIRQAQAFHRWLALELGERPSPVVQDLEAAVLNQASVLDRNEYLRELGVTRQGGPTWSR